MMFTTLQHLYLYTFTWLDRLHLLTLIVLSSFSLWNTKGLILKYNLFHESTMNSDLNEHTHHNHHSHKYFALSHTHKLLCNGFDRIAFILILQGLGLSKVMQAWNVERFSFILIKCNKIYFFMNSVINKPKMIKNMCTFCIQYICTCIYKI